MSSQQVRPYGPRGGCLGLGGFASGVLCLEPRMDTNVVGEAAAECGVVGATPESPHQRIQSTRRTGATAERAHHLGGGWNGLGGCKGGHEGGHGGRPYGCLTRWAPLRDRGEHDGGI
jgi:hypothetical protein